MTSVNPPRRATTRRQIGYRGGGGGLPGSGNGQTPVGEQLRQAREGKGFDLHRVERDTKIRIKYLEALESGDFADLPGDVYARGFRATTPRIWAWTRTTSSTNGVERPPSRSRVGRRWQGRSQCGSGGEWFSSAAT